MEHINQLFEEWKKLNHETFAYRTMSLEDVSDETYNIMESKYGPMYKRFKDIVIELQNLGYEIVDGDKPYSRELKKLQ